MWQGPIAQTYSQMVAVYGSMCQLPQFTLGTNHTWPSIYPVSPEPWVPGKSRLTIITLTKFHADKQHLITNPPVDLEILNLGKLIDFSYKAIYFSGCDRMSWDFGYSHARSLPMRSVILVAVPASWKKKLTICQTTLVILYMLNVLFASPLCKYRSIPWSAPAGIS